jgi:hypothetical protein
MSPRQKPTTSRPRQLKGEAKPEEWAWVTGQLPRTIAEQQAAGLGIFRCWHLLYPGGSRIAQFFRRRTWRAWEEEALAWVAEHRPGTRPEPWWEFSAPKWDDPYKGEYFHGTRPEPRKRLGGSGRPDWEVRGTVPRLPLGVPLLHLDVDPIDPPVYESQATYLKRHNLLLPGEEKRIPKPGFKPETITNPPSKERAK